MTKRKSILKVVHETARGLRDAGLMDTKTIREFDALRLPKVTAYTPRQIKRLRWASRRGYPSTWALALRA